MTDTEFEEFVFDLVVALGWRNVDWRKGTPLASSPADSGRDIEAEYVTTGLDGSVDVLKHFFEAKHYSAAVPPAALAGALAWAQAERPDALYVVASGFLSNPCKDYLKRYMENNRPPFKIKTWERPQLVAMAGGLPVLLDKYELSKRRTTQELMAAEAEFVDRLMGPAFMALLDEFVDESDYDPAIPEDAEELSRLDQIRLEVDRIRATWGEDACDTLDPGQYGMLRGKLSAIRWVLEAEWDDLEF